MRVTSDTQNVAEARLAQLLQAGQAQQARPNEAEQREAKAEEAKVEETKQMSETDLEKLIQEVEKRPELENKNIKFRINRQEDQLQVEILDTERDKVINKFPPDELVHLASDLKKMAGVRMNKLT